jgi:fructose-1,6-bisphosphatase I
METVAMTHPMTLVEHITRSQQAHPAATGAFTLLMTSLAVSAKVVSREVNRAGIGKLLGLAGRRNIQGEDVARLDEFANETMVQNLNSCGSACALASEELAVPILLPAPKESGRYAVCFDPLDGSSNIDVNVSVGTIFGIYRRLSAAGKLGEERDLVRSPKELVAAGYAVYGSSTVFVYTAGNGVHGFTLDPSIGEFLLSHPDMKVPKKGKILSVNSGNRQYWDEATRQAIRSFEEPGEGASPYTGRYIGSLVADAHRTLLRGGLFCYPADNKSPQGKLRLLYEAGPLAKIFEQAGGAATNGRQPILDIEPEGLHDRTPLILGSVSEVETYRRFVEQEPAAEKDAAQAGDTEKPTAGKAAKKAAKKTPRKG